MQRARKQQRIDDGLAPGLARLQAVVNLRGTSNSALKEIMARLGANQGPSANALTDAMQARFRSVMRIIDVENEDGSVWSWPLCDPNLLLTRMLHESPPLQRIFSEALAQRPCSASAPWRLIVGFDEFVPGNKLQLQPARKSMNLSFSFLELGRSDRTINHARHQLRT